MAARKNQGERLTALETELPHVWQAVKASTEAADALRADLKNLQDQTRDLCRALQLVCQLSYPLLMAAALHTVGPSAAEKLATLLVALRGSLGLVL